LYNGNGNTGDLVVDVCDVGVWKELWGEEEVGEEIGVRGGGGGGG